MENRAFVITIENIMEKGAFVNTFENIMEKGAFALLEQMFHFP